MITLYFIQKSIYGNDLYYPDCDATRNIATISKRKTFDIDALRLLKKTYCFDVKINTIELDI